MSLSVIPWEVYSVDLWPIDGLATVPLGFLSPCFGAGERPFEGVLGAIVGWPGSATSHVNEWMVNTLRVSEPLGCHSWIWIESNVQLKERTKRSIGHDFCHPTGQKFARIDSPGRTKDDSETVCPRSLSKVFYQATTAGSAASPLPRRAKAQGKSDAR